MTELPKIIYNKSEGSKYLGIAPSTWRYWERKGWISPPDYLTPQNQEYWSSKSLEGIRNTVDAKADPKYRRPTGPRISK